MERREEANGFTGDFGHSMASFLRHIGLQTMEECSGYRSVKIKFKKSWQVVRKFSRDLLKIELRVQDEEQLGRFRILNQ